MFKIYLCKEFRTHSSNDSLVNPHQTEKPNVDYVTQQNYKGVSKSFRTGRLERELQMVQLTATWCSCNSILGVSLVTFAATTLCAASQQVFHVVFYFVMTQSENFWIHPRILTRGAYFLQAHYHTTFQSPKLSSANIVPTAEVCTAIMWI
jgi:hypothetical protein